MGSTKRRRSWRGSTASTTRLTGRVTGRISSLNGSGCWPNGRGGFGGLLSTAKFPTAGHRPIPKTRIPGSIPNGRWRPGCRRNTGCFGRYCSPGRIANCWKIAVELLHRRASLFLGRLALGCLLRLFWLARSPGSI